LAFSVLADASNTMAVHIMLFAPAVVVFGVGERCTSSNRAELRAKILSAVLASAGLIALGIPNYLHVLGSDLTKHGFWVLGIPTFEQERFTITSRFYRMVSELLTLPEGKQIRSFMIPTQPVGPILELWGVRFILTDQNLPFGTLVMTKAADKYTSGAEAPEPARFKLPLNLHELEHANLGNYSPTSVERAQDARELVARMREPEFDGGKHLIVTEELAGNFVPAVGASMTVREGGFDLMANSAAEALLVLPVQYSHCRELSGQGDASLFRANFLQLGVRFKGDLYVELRQRFGPLRDSACRLANADDMERLRIEETRP